MAQPSTRQWRRFVGKHAKLQEENERFWLSEAQTWAELLKAKNAFWHQFAGKPKLSGQHRQAT
jgi:hypothetical protein